MKTTIAEERTFRYINQTSQWLQDRKAFYTNKFNLDENAEFSATVTRIMADTLIYRAVMTLSCDSDSFLNFIPEPVINES